MGYMSSRLIPGLVLVALVGACADAEPVGTTTSAPATTTTEAAPTTPAYVTTTTSPPPSTTTPLPEFPPARQDLEHGGATWAVVLAGAADPGDPAITAAIAAAEEAGYTTGPTDCDEGAPEALGLSGSVLTVSVYFETEADAQAAAAAFEARGVPGVVAEVRTFCLD